MRDVYEVRTPENVVFEFELAGVASRAMAWAVDLVVMGALIASATCLLSMAQAVAGGLAVALQLVAVFLVQWWYSALTEWWLGGQTVGKKVVGLRSLDERGVRMSFLQAVIRNLLRVVDLMPGLYLVGGVTALMDSGGRRLGDMAAGTVVVRERRAPKPSAFVAPTERHNAFLEDRQVAYAARRISPPVRDVMIALGLRRDELPMPVRHELFGRLSEHLEVGLGVARPHYLSEERFVLNIAAVVLRRAAAKTQRPGPRADPRL